MPKARTLTTHEKYAAKVRAEGRTVTPYRIGLAVGAAGDNLPSPYPPGTRGDHSYLAGMEYGRTERRINARRLRSALLAWEAMMDAEQYEANLLAYLEGQKFHPSASHVPPDYRDGYNRALQVVIERVQDDQRMRARGVPAVGPAEILRLADAYAEAAIENVRGDDDAKDQDAAREALASALGVEGKSK